MPKPRVNVLLSFPYFTSTFRRVLERYEPASFRLIVDSGAFTAWSMGETVDLDEYEAFLRGLRPEWDMQAIQLDVIGDPRATLKNFMQHIKHDMPVIPVFTRGAKLNDRDVMYEHADTVCLGGLVSSPEYIPFMRHFMSTNQGRGVHWLGYTNITDLKRYRPTSVDASNITGAQRFGAISYYAGAGVARSVHKTEFAQRPPEEFMRASRRLGFTNAELRRMGLAESWRGDVARKVDAPQRPNSTGTGFASFVHFAHAVARAIDIERNIGTRVYFAMSQPEQLDGIFRARDFLAERGVFGWATRNERAAYA